MQTEETLQQGLKLFQQKNTQYFSEQEYSDSGKKFIKAHDVAHVVFGCDTTIYGEGIVKLWTTFGTDQSFKEITAGYKDVNAYELSRGYSFSHVTQNILRLIKAVPKTILRARKMSKPWSFYNYQTYLDTPISAIRQEFNIDVL